MLDLPSVCCMEYDATLDLGCLLLSVLYDVRLDLRLSVLYDVMLDLPSVCSH